MFLVKQGKCIDHIKQLVAQKRKVHAVITDPPYDYDIIGVDWNQSELNRRLELAKAKNYGVQHLPYGNARRGGVRDAAWFKNEQQKVAEYIEWTKEWASQCYKILHSGGFIAVCINNTSAAHVQVALESVGFYTKEILVLIKPSNIRKGISLHQAKTRRGLAVSESDKNYGSVTNNLTELVVLAHKPFKKGITTYLDNHLLNGIGFIDCSKLTTNVLRSVKEPVDDEFHHVNRKPLSAMLALVGGLTSANQIVLDPFCGSGTTGVACKMLGRSFVGIELQKATAIKAKKRISLTNYDSRIQLF